MFSDAKEHTRSDHAGRLSPQRTPGRFSELRACGSRDRGISNLRAELRRHLATREGALGGGRECLARSCRYVVRLQSSARCWQQGEQELGRAYSVDTLVIYFGWVRFLDFRGAYIVVKSGDGGKM